MINEGKLSEQGLFTSKKDDWQTPQWLFDKLNKHFEFVADVCATDQNTKCDIYFDKNKSCLEHDWFECNFMNPPYGRGIGKFIEKAYWQWWDNDCTTVSVLPARTDTKWFHSFIYNKADITFMKGRLKFEGGHILAPAPFPTMIVIWWGSSYLNNGKYLSNEKMQEFINSDEKQVNLKLDLK
tara:strand:- start:60 stop:605 length:546 start_codon:yes stop_codon:yes gene_type:complete